MQVLKTFTYGAMHLSVAILVAYVLTGDWAIALGVGIIEPIVQTFAYTFHEKIWALIKGDQAPLSVCSA